MNCADKDGCLPETSSQTAGPFVHLGCQPSSVFPERDSRSNLGERMYRESANGERITVIGRVFDGIGKPVEDALLEFWQTDAQGLYPSSREPRGKADPHFAGWARRACDQKTGEWRLDTIRPGAMPDADGIEQAPHIAIWIVARGIGLGLYTRLYFDDDERNAQDPLLNIIQPQRRRRTMMASFTDEAWRFNIHLQGEQETVFINA